MIHQRIRFTEHLEPSNDNQRRTLTMHLNHANQTIDELHQWFENPYFEINDYRTILKHIDAYRDLARGIVLGYYV